MDTLSIITVGLLTLINVATAILTWKLKNQMTGSKDMPKNVESEKKSERTGETINTDPTLHPLQTNAVVIVNRILKEWRKIHSASEPKSNVRRELDTRYIPAKKGRVRYHFSNKAQIYPPVPNSRHMQKYSQASK